ncbi:MAG: hypothetical protein DRI57_01155 [Deltaproteobacteria bacterium]|nr:MAG: hypothetical protein DRI57_01155 [Deltaproteobacteria bacterium]
MINSFNAEQTDAGLNFDIHLDKGKSAYCFIGENGAGKTNLLENMAKTLIYCHSMFKYKKENHLKYAAIFFETYIIDKIKDFKMDLPLNISLNENKIKDKERDKFRVAIFEHLPNADTNLIYDKPIVFIGAKNRGYTNNIDRNHIRILGNSYDRFLEALYRSFSYMSGKSLEDTEIADWFNSRLIINPKFVPQHQNRAAEVVSLLMLIQELEPDLEDLIVRKNSETNIDILFDEGRLLFNKIPIDKLATGYVAIIKIFQEIVAGYGGWTGLADTSADLSDVEGIVFIDEIESHLHPRWQYKIIPLLKRFFPKTIFYIATHSPAIVAATDHGEAYELKRQGNNVTAKKLGNPREWYLADVFSQGFHLDFDAVQGEAGTPDLTEMLKNFSVMVKDHINKDRNLKEDIENLYQRILPSLAADDPRCRSLNSLKSLVK